MTFSLRALLLLALCAVPAHWALAQTSCETCHSEVKVVYQGTAHQEAGMTCVDCHGGDPKDLETSAMDPAKGFRKPPTRAQIPAFCAHCHANRNLMRSYGLPADQMEEYQTSYHGQAIARGDLSAAVCVDCHGQHGIWPTKDPRSSVYPTKVPATCGRCHSNQKLMSRHGIPSGQYEAYKESVHGVALLRGGNLAVPTCATCHGSHGALPPDVTHIVDICGRCHGEVRDLVRASVHGPIFDTAQEPGCLACHGNAHHLQHPTTELFVSACGKCHQRDTDDYALGLDLKKQIDQAGADLDKAEASLKETERHHRLKQEWSAALDQAHTNRVRAAAVQHSLELHKVEQNTELVAGVAEEIALQLKQEASIQRVRRFILLGVWAFVGLTCLACYWQRRRSEEQRHHSRRTTAS